MATKSQIKPIKVLPLSLRDFSRGRYAKSAVNPALVPVNSVANAVNVNFDTTIGSGTVRDGTVPLGVQVIGNIVTQEHYTGTSDDYSADYGGTHLQAQIFTPTSTHTVSSVKAKLFRNGTLSGGQDLFMSIRAVSAGVPTGNDLAVSEYMDPSNLTTGTAGVYYTFPIQPMTLTAGTSYALVLRELSGDASNYVAWRRNSAQPYGSGAFSTDGNTWSTSNFTYLFEEDSLSADTLQTPLGLTEFKTASTNSLVGVFYSSAYGIPAGQPVMYWFDGTNFRPARQVVLTANAYHRFSVLNGYCFVVNGTDNMQSSNNLETWSTSNCIGATTPLVKPSLIFRSGGRLLASGDSVYPSRVYFSAIVAPASSPFLTWNTTATTGDFIDVNPDDGSGVTGFDQVGPTVLVYKTNGTYRLDAIATSITPYPIFNTGAYSQESVTNCQNMSYFFNGTAIWRTAGDVPEQLSRLGVQDFIDAIPQTSWGNVILGHDDFNVYVNIGTVTLNTGRDSQRTYTNVTLKFSVRDQNWTVHEYGQRHFSMSSYTTASGKLLLEADDNGFVQKINSGNTDNGQPIFYEVETQEQEFGNRAHWKKVSDQIVVYAKNGQDSNFQVKQDEADYKDLQIGLSDRVNISESVNLAAHYLSFKWFGQSAGTPPVFEGLYIENIDDEGVSNG